MSPVDRTFRVVSFFTGLSFGMVLPVLFIFLKDKGISNIELAVLAVTATVTTTLFELPSGNIADKFGRKKTFLVGQVPFILFCIAITVSDSFVGLAFAMFLSGLSTAMISGTMDSIYVQSYNQQAQHETLQAKLAKLGLFSISGTLIGALLGIALGLLVEHSSYRLFAAVQDRIFLLVGCFSMLMAFYVAKRVVEPPFPLQGKASQRRSADIRELFNESVAIFFRSKHLLVINATSMVAAAAYMCFEKFWQLQVDSLTGDSISKTVFYYFFCGGLVVSIFGQRFSIKLCEIFNQNLIYPLVVTRLVLIAAFILLAYSSSMAVFIVCFVLIYLASSSSASPVIALFHRYASDDLRSSMLSIRSVSVQVGATLGVLQAGYVSHYYSINLAFLSSAVLYVASTAIILFSAHLFQPGYKEEHQDA